MVTNDTVDRLKKMRTKSKAIGFKDKKINGDI